MDISVKKLGIVTKSPALVVVYQAGEKLRRKIIPLRDFAASDSETLAYKLKEREILKTVPVVKIKKMLRLIEEVLAGKNMTEAIEKIQKQFELKVNEDLNKLPVQELQLQKELMEALFLKNQIKMNDNDFVYDKRLDFDSEKKDSSWDLENDDDFWDRENE